MAKRERTDEEKDELRKRRMAQLTPFKKGEIRNPKGRPKNDTKTSKESLKAQFSEKITFMVGKKKVTMSVLEAITKAQVTKAIRGDTRAFDAVLDRTEGKPIQTQVIISDFESKFSSLSVQELIELREIAKKEAEAVGVVYVPVIELKE